MPWRCAVTRYVTAVGGRRSGRGAEKGADCCGWRMALIFAVGERCCFFAPGGARCTLSLWKGGGGGRGLV